MTTLDSNAAAVGEKATKATDPVQEIKADIERTQADLAETVAALQERLQPAHLLERAKRAARDAARQTLQNVQSRARAAATTAACQAERSARLARERVRSEPVPIVLVAAGVATLLWRAYASADRRGGRRPPRRGR